MAVKPQVVFLRQAELTFIRFFQIFKIHLRILDKQNSYSGYHQFISDIKNKHLFRISNIVILIIRNSYFDIRIFLDIRN